MNIFISYSRVDRDLVVPIVAALRIGGEVFRDEDNIKPGDCWADVLIEALKSCETVILFWSRAACESRNVEAECRQALDSGKYIIPVLLDDTPLPEFLAHIQWLDFRPFLEAAARRCVIGTLVAPTAMLIPLGGVFFNMSIIRRLANRSRVFSERQRQLAEFMTPFIFFEDEEAESMRRLLNASIEQRFVTRT